MPFSFKEADYRNTFPAEVTESILIPVPNDPSREMWQLTLLRLKFNAGKNTWEPIESPFPCQLPGCTISPWHTHTRFYESERSGSPSHKFILSITNNTTIILMGPGDILNKRFTFEEEIWPSRVNPQTGLKGKDQYYYFIKGALGQAPDVSHADNEPDELPFDTGQPVVSQPVAAAAPPPVSQPVETPTNGTATARSMTIDDAAVLLLPMVDGKTKPEIQKIIVQDEAIRSTPGFLVAFMQNKVRDKLVADGFITEDEAGVWHLAQ
jgi:hypothetical protein